MAIKQLSEEQVRTWTLEQKDRWWLENVYQGNVPQFTLRAGIMGFLLGFVLSVTNLYVGAKTGWTLGVGITSVILAYALFKSILGLWDAVFPETPARPYHVLENNIMQSIATAAGYMTAPLISSLAAYMIVMTERAGEPVIVPWWQSVTWLFILAILGVLFAFPMKRRFINDEQHPFPEGRAAGVVMDTLHSQREGQISVAPKLLIWTGLVSAILKIGQAESLMHRFTHNLLRIPETVSQYLKVPEFLDGWFYALCNKLGFTPNIMGTSLRDLTIRPELDIAMIGAGGLMGIRTGVSLMIGAIINYCILAPIMIHLGDIKPTAAGAFGFRQITAWALWGGVAMMTTASLFAFFSKPQMLLKSFKGMAGRGREGDDPMKPIELPMRVFFIGIPVVGAITVWMAHSYFGVPWYWAAVAIPMVFVFCLIAANSTALTSITPTGAMGKLTQLTFGILARGDIGTNLMTAGITGEVAGNSSNLLMNIKPGYMLGGKPRLQALGHCLGAVSGAIAAVAVFYPLFLRNNPVGLISETYPMPAAAIWKAVAEILTKGLSELPTSAMWAALIGAVLGIAMEGVKLATKGKFTISAVGIGLAFVIPFTTCLAMAFGAFVFWAIEKWPAAKGDIRKTIVENQEPICAGVIAGAALMGIATMALEVFVFSH